jgi:UDP-GlcNAc:undecaprenyl-phosphate GlcNAc-1-phosphate transferase
MADLAVLSGLAVLSSLLTWVMIRVRILDVPNARSSHDRLVPRAGGIAIVATFFTGLALAGPGRFWGLAAGALAVALVGLADDLGRIGTWGKLAGQVVAAAILISSGIVVRDIGPWEIGGWGYPVTVVWLVAMTNLVNFMDGLDGLAGGTAAIAGLSLAALALPSVPPVAQASAALGAACIGFTVFNAPRARVFMGDVGSEFLGFALAGLAVYAAEADGGYTPFLVMPLLMFHFIFDTCFTFCRRLSDGENVTQAHRGHLYQLMNRLGASHIQVSLFHWAVGLAQALGAYLMLSLDGVAQLTVFIPFLVFEAGYAAIIMRTVRRRGIRPG